MLCNKTLISISDNKIKDKEDPSEENCESDSWMKRKDINTAFPKEWQEEKYDNHTENSPISSFNLMGVPQVNDCEESEHQNNLDRLFDIRNDLYKGHFEASNSHFRFFIDTESYVRKESNNGKGELMKWIDELKGIFHSSNMLENNKLDILITPNAESESDFIHTINDKVFSGRALIVYLDINNEHASCVEKCSFLKYLDEDNIRFHYVDHILFTGETYQRTKSLLYSIIGDQDESTPNKDEIKQEQNNQNTDNPIRTFDSIITVINHLSFTKDKEIKIDVKKNLFAFINLYYPSSRFNSRDCQLCRLEEYYNELSKKTVLDNCQTKIRKYLEKLKLKNIKEIKKEPDRNEIKEVSDRNEIKKISDRIKRNFIRLVMTHELCFRLSQIAWGRSDFYDITRNEISEELDSIYGLLSNQHYSGAHHTKSNINDRINNWFKSEIVDNSSESQDFINKELEIDKKISFLKVISSPPLCQYVIIREYAHRKLLSVLYEILNKKNENDYTYDDLKIVKSILKSLSFMKSNALVRKDVIVGVWKILGIVINRFEKDKKDIEKKAKKTEEKIAIIVDKLKKQNPDSQPIIPEGKTRKRLISTLRQKKRDLISLNDKKEDIEKSIDDTIKDFSRDVQFFIKNAIVKDDAKATFLGELLRRGTEMSSSGNIISKTKLSLNVQNDKNDMFEHFKSNKSFPNTAFKKEYIDFLVWLFYDNTTIIRKTLDNFSDELKEKRFNVLFRYKVKDKDKDKDKDKEEYLLKDIDYFKDTYNINKTAERYYYKIDSEHYYASFRPYLKNGDNIYYVNKLIYVLYAKLKLEDLIINKNKTSIETDIKGLLNVFSEIMGADAAFLIMKKDKKSCPVSVYKKDDPAIEWDYQEWLLDDFYTRQIISLNNSIYPYVPLYNIRKLEKAAQKFGERYVDYNTHSLSIYVSEHSDLKTRTTITFLYNRKNSLIRDEAKFRINIQESGRLLLLLKNDIDRYLIDYLIKEKVFDLWLENNQSYLKFEKTYLKSNHTFNSVFDEMEKFEKFEMSIIQISYQIWYFLTNQTISFFYSHIEKNISNGLNPISPKLGSKYIRDDNNTLGKTFNDSFIKLLICLLDNRWNKKNENNAIVINDQDIHEFSCLEKKLSKTHIRINKHLLRTFIVQCLHNSLSKSKHGHRRKGEIKKIHIKIKDKSISIEDECIKDVLNATKKSIKVKKFNIKKKHIRQLNCDEYSSTTLTTLQGVFNYMNDENSQGKYRCEYGFNNKCDFVVTLYFNK